MTNTKLVSIDAQKTGLFNELVLAYLSKEEKLTPFISAWPDIEGYQKMISERKRYPIDRTLISEVFRSQYQNIELTSLESEHIGLLKDENTFTVTTGQQTHAFLGPLYVWWKALTTIGICRFLKTQFQEYQFVPVFWMATEDHDFEEINHLNVFGKRFEWNKSETGNGPVGRIDTTELLKMFAEIESLFESEEAWRPLGETLRKAYGPGITLAAATRSILHDLLGDQGLLVLDPDDVRLKKAFIPIIKKELKEQQTEKDVLASIYALKELGYPTQVNPREINLFFFDGVDRKRLVKVNNVYYLNGGSELFTLAELDTFVDKNYFAFSGNVVLRPIYQELILPNLAYVGGPGELSYWLEYRKMFQNLNVFYPILENRKSFFVMKQSQNTWLGKNRIPVSQLWNSEQELLAYLMELSGNQLVTLKEELLAIEGIKQKVIHNVKQVSGFQFRPVNQLFSNLEKELVKVEKEIHNLQKNQIETMLNKALTIKKTWVNNSFVQERNEPILAYWHQIDDAELISLIANNPYELSTVNIITKNQNKPN